MKSRKEWMSGDKHLPYFMQDFHDQKDLFKTIDEWDTLPRNSLSVNWMQAHCYVIDKFLRFMATCGYTLQKTRTSVDQFDDVEKLIEARRKRESAEFFAALKK